jgi:hypothetical protein
VSEYHQDFRGAQRPTLPWDLIGPDADTTVALDERGLRVTLPATRMRLFEPVGVALKRKLPGDFEFTGSYEVLAAAPPPRGTGVGIALNIAAGGKFTRFGRFFRVAEGSVYLAEYWNNAAPSERRLRCVPTAAQSGQLRLVRTGSTLRYLIADKDGTDFEEIERGEFGTEDLDVVRFVVHNNDSPAVIDARLVNITLRRIGAAVDAGEEMAGPSRETPRPIRRSWLVAAALLCGLLALALLVLFFFRHRATK